MSGKSGLKVALDKAMQSLGDERFQRLVGDVKKPAERKRRSTLLEAARPAQRSASAAIANKVLGPESDVKWRKMDLRPDLRDNPEARLEDIVSSRFVHLRRGDKWLNETEEIRNETSQGENILGLEDDGTPVWRRILEEQRSRLMAIEPERVKIQRSKATEYIEYSLPDWPEVIPKSSEHTFNEYHVCPENLHAARAIDAILDEPAKRWNPLLINGESGTGKSHLLWACGLQMARQDPSRLVRIINCGQLDEERPAGWQRTLAATSMLLIDDLQAILDAPDSMQKIGEVVDHAINVGVQVVICTSDTDFSATAGNRLAQVLNGTRMVTLRRPGLASRMTYLRERSAIRRLLLDDLQLSAIEAESPGDWRSLAQSLEVVAEAIERGASLDQLMDISTILRGEYESQIHEMPEDREDIESLSKGMISEAVEYVEHIPLDVDIELEIPSVDLPPDDYEVPDLMPKDSKTAVDNLVDRHLGEELERMKEPVVHAVSVNERERHLIDERREPDAKDLIRVKGDLAIVDELIDDAFNKADRRVVNEAEVLSSLLEELQTLSEKMATAKARDLIRLVDRLYDIEMKLHTVDPVRWPVPEMPKSRRPVKRIEPEPEPEPEEIFDSMQSGNSSVASLRALTILTPTEEE